jgi:hypothetical protein
MRSAQRSRTLLAPAALLLALSACAADELSNPPASFEGTLTVNASAGWGYASLTDSALVAPIDPAASTEWEIAFNATRVMLNGGAAGNGDVAAYCICQNAGATNEQVIAMTAEGELADFEGVDASDIPAAGAFVEDSLVPVMNGWYAGVGAAATANSAKSFLLRLNNDTSFAKARVIGITAPSAGNAGTVTVEYALQVNSAAGFGAVDTIEVVAGTPTYVDLNSGATVTELDGWDLRLEGWTFKVNGGVSGSGKVGVSPSTAAFGEITTAALPAQAYSTDAFGGVFNGAPWYRYNIDPGAPNHIHPTFNVYLIRSGNSVYRIQLIDYYGPAGETRRISIRFARISE